MPPQYNDTDPDTCEDDTQGSTARERQAAAESPTMELTSAELRPLATRESELARTLATTESALRTREGLWAGKIELQRKLGEGGMGYVFVGRDVHLRRALAVKVLRAEEANEKNVLRFIDEAQITAQLEHPNIVPVHEIGLDPDGRAFFTMKRVRGESLEEILRHREVDGESAEARFSLRRLLDVFLGVCQAMEYAHSRGVVHRDLKPANVMVGDFGEVLVMDWGIAQVSKETAPTPGEPSDHGASNGPDGDRAAPTDTARTEPPISTTRSDDAVRRTVEGTLIGTLAYMSPEQARGDAVDARSDVHALGAMLYEILCGRPPFGADNWNAILAGILTQPPIPPSEVRTDGSVPPALEALTLRLLEKDPERRDIPIGQIRARIQDYIEGIGREYRSETIVGRVAWGVGGLALFGFLVWYLSGQALTRFLDGSALLNTLGWFLLIHSLWYPLWASGAAFRISRVPRDPFVQPTLGHRFVTGLMAHRTLAAAIAPLAQFAFLGELVFEAIPAMASADAADRAASATVLADLTTAWHGTLEVILVFLFVYTYLFSSEIRYARSLDRYEHVAVRRRWELVWPFFLIFGIASSAAAVEFVGWSLSQQSLDVFGFLQTRVFGTSLDFFAITKSVVFQGTFLTTMVGVSLLFSFPLPELLAALKLPYHSVDEARDLDREHYFMRSLSVYQAAQIMALFGGVLVTCLTAITGLAFPGSGSFLPDMVGMLAPSALGVAGFLLIRGHAAGYLAGAPLVAQMRDRRVKKARDLERAALLVELQRSTWRHRVYQLAIPAACVGSYLVWQALTEVRPSTSALVVLAPYALLVVAIALRGPAQLAFLERRSSLAGDAQRR